MISKKALTRKTGNIVTTEDRLVPQRWRIRKYNLISQQHWKRNRNLIHCSVTGKKTGGGTKIMRERE